MKRMSQISRELREQGCMFSQTKFASDLLAFDPVFKEGKVVFYADGITNDMVHLYKRRKVKAYEIAPSTAVQEIEPTYSRLDRIEKMLESISGYLDLTVPA